MMGKEKGKRRTRNKKKGGETNFVTDHENSKEEKREGMRQDKQQTEKERGDRESRESREPKFEYLNSKEWKAKQDTDHLIDQKQLFLSVVALKEERR